MSPNIPALTTEQMRTVDRLMIEEYGIQLIQMMENAGRSLAELARRMLGGAVRGKHIGVLCGLGNNGGGGMVAARHLHNWGAKVTVMLVGEEKALKPVPAQQWQIITALDIRAKEFEPKSMNLLLDAMLGYGLVGDPRPPLAHWIEATNDSGVPLLSLDTPSGLDTTSGIPGSPCIQADSTLTLALPKTGLLEHSARAYIGDLYVADIGVPPQLYTRLSLDVPALFDNEMIVRLEADQF